MQIYKTWSARLNFLFNLPKWIREDTTDKMSYRLVLLLLLLSLIVLVYSKTLVKRATYDLENRDGVNGDNTRIDSVKRDIQPQGMQRIEFCFKNPRHRWCIVDRPTMRVEIIRD